MVGPVAVVSLQVHTFITGLPLPSESIYYTDIIPANCPAGSVSTGAGGTPQLSQLSWDVNSNPNQPCAPALQDLYNKIAIQVRPPLSLLSCQRILS